MFEHQSSYFLFLVFYWCAKSVRTKPFKFILRKFYPIFPIMTLSIVHVYCVETRNSLDLLVGEEPIKYFHICFYDNYMKTTTWRFSVFTFHSDHYSVVPFIKTDIVRLQMLKSYILLLLLLSFSRPFNHHSYWEFEMFIKWLQIFYISRNDFYILKIY